MRGMHRACGMSVYTTRLYYSAWLASSHISKENPTKDVWLADEIQAGWDGETISGREASCRESCVGYYFFLVARGIPAQLTLRVGEIAKGFGKRPILLLFVVVRLFRWEEDLGNGRRLVTKVMFSSKD